jgi:transposase
MPKFKDYNQNQSMLLPPNIRDWLPSDHICFIINDVVNNLDISCVKSTYSDKGSPAYSPQMLVKVLFYSYTQGIRSSRRIEQATQENIVHRYLSANQQPDHGTINLFRKNHLTDLENLFAQIVILCDGLNIIDPTDISIDGTVIKANASKKKTYTSEEIIKLKKKIREILNEANQIDEEEDKKFGNKRGYNQMPDKLKDPETRQKEIKRLQEKMKQLKHAEEKINEKQKQAKTGEEKRLSRNTTHNTTDPDAKLMKMKKGKSYQPAYNAQIATNNQIILSCDVTDDGNDNKQLLPMIEKTENTTGKQIDKVKADAIYFSKDNIGEVDQKEIDAYIPDQQKALEERQERNNAVPKYDRRNFKYDKQKNEFICPQGKRLHFVRIDKEYHKYICSDCGNCPVKTQCVKGKNRQLHIDWQFEKLKAKMRKKLNSKLGKNKYLERMSDVEPPFGNIIYNQGAGHFLCRGRPMVKTEFGLSCIAHNLVKIANWIRKDKNKTQFDTLMRLPAVA